MTAHQSQHFVPRFWLKHFATNEAATHTCLFHIKTRRCVRQASIREQCARDFYYGRDGRLEKAFCTLEGAAAAVIHRIMRKDVVPAPYTAEMATFLEFVMAQLGRTPAATAQLDATMNGYFQHAMKTHPAGPRAAPVMSVKNGLLWKLGLMIKAQPVIEDLRLKVLRAPGPLEFVLGDAPVVLHNQWLRRLPIGTCGLASSGLLIALPLSPTYLALLYDTAVYHVGPSSVDIVHLRDQREVEAFNALQYASATNNLYHRSPAMSSTLLALPQDLRAKPFGLDVARFKEDAGASHLIVASSLAHKVDIPPGTVRVKHEKAIMSPDERCEYENRVRLEAMARVDELVPQRPDRRPPRPGTVFSPVSDD